MFTGQRRRGDGLMNWASSIEITGELNVWLMDMQELRQQLQLH